MRRLLIAGAAAGVIGLAAAAQAQAPDATPPQYELPPPATGMPRNLPDPTLSYQPLDASGHANSGNVNCAPPGGLTTGTAPPPAAVPNQPCR